MFIILKTDYFKFRGESDWRIFLPEKNMWDLSKLNTFNFFHVIDELKNKSLHGGSLETTLTVPLSILSFTNIFILFIFI